MIGAVGLRVTARTGVVYNPLSDRWSLSTDTAVNYIVTAS
jgi:2-polyprenyl-6-hydroxyphenyl methylase/3-demethylubiquinone-9 3-methyltransferase